MAETLFKLLSQIVTGIMAILFNGIVMSHYSHYNLSPVTQITMQQTLRTLAFIAGDLELALKSTFKRKFNVILIISFWFHFDRNLCLCLPRFSPFQLSTPT